MYRAVAYYSGNSESWRIVIGIYQSETEANKAILKHAGQHETDIFLQYYQIEKWEG